MVGRRVGGSPATPKPKPRLERLIASKNIDYEIPSTSFLSFEDSSESASSASPGLRTRSLDASPLAVNEQTSFRIEGTQGECEMILRSLGLSGPEDFAIPSDDWEAMKVRSSTDVVASGFLRLNFGTCSAKGFDSDAETKSSWAKVVSDVVSPKVEGFESFNSRSRVSLTSPKIEGIDFGCSDSIASSNVSLTSPKIVGIDFGCSDSSGGSDASSKIDLVCSRKFVTSDVIMNRDKLIIGDGDVNVAIDGVCELSGRLASIVVCELSDRLGDCGRASDVTLTTNGAVDLSVVRDSHAIVNDSESSKFLGRGGIKGARPPALAPPPAMSLPVIDDGCSTWDILKSFAPENERDSLRFIDSGAVSSKYEEIRNGYVEEEEEVHDAGVRSVAGVNGVLLGSGSCSFTTNSIDDDSSSTTTEPMSNNSPNERFRCIITYWEKGELLGRGSFGSVYEGIAE